MLDDFDLSKTTNLLQRPIDTACELIENILGEPTKHLGLYLTDHIVYWQWANRINIFEKAQEKMKEKRLIPHKLSKDFAVPFLRECGDTSDEELQEWWSELLTSAIKDDAYCHVSFVHTLKLLNTCDAVFIYTLLQYGPFDKKERSKMIAKHSKITVEQAQISYYNLESLGFFTPTGKRLKGYAVEFIKACCGNIELVPFLKS